MDSKKQMTSLDPKLKETYDRVMGMNLPSAPASNGNNNPPANQTNTPNQAAAPPAPPQPVNSDVPKPPTDAVGVVTSIHSEEVKQMTNPKTTTISLKQGISPIIFLIIAIGLFMFFIIYTFFWLRYFNVQIPFLPSFY